MIGREEGCKHIGTCPLDANNIDVCHVFILSVSTRASMVALGSSSRYTRHSGQLFFPSAYHLLLLKMFVASVCREANGSEVKPTLGTNRCR
jgi:hypothetical protein